MNKIEAEIQKTLDRMDTQAAAEIRNGFMDRDTYKSLRKFFSQALYYIVEVEREERLKDLGAVVVHWDEKEPAGWRCPKCGKIGHSTKSGNYECDRREEVK